MPYLITDASKSENLLIDSLFYGLATVNYETTKSEILKISRISNLDRINFYLFRKYAFTLLEGIEVFEDQLKRELKDLCLKIKG